MNPKMGMRKKGTGENPSKWSIPSPGGYKPENAPAKPQGGTRAPAAATKKTANTPSGTKGLDASIKSRF